MKPIHPFFLFVLALAASASCSRQPPVIRLAYDQSDSSYRQTASLLQPILQEAGYDVRLTPVAHAIEGARLVARGEADFSLIMDQTSLDTILGRDIYRLRTVLPLFRRVVYILYRPEVPDDPVFTTLIRGRSIYAGKPGDEKYTSFLRFMNYTGFTGFSITTDSTQADITFFWDDTSAERAEALCRAGWKIFSIRSVHRDALCLRLGRLTPYDLPPTPSMRRDDYVLTIASDAILITSDRQAEDDVYAFTRALLAAKPRLVVHNPVYERMDENISSDELPYPLSPGVESYLRREEPTFWEKYAEVMGLTLAILAGASGLVQSLRLYWQRRRKERLDKYLLAFAAAKGKPDKEDLLEEMLNQALRHLTEERLDRGDFDILARLIYAELRMGGNRKDGPENENFE